LDTLHAITADMNDFAPPPFASADGRFDRIVSIEMFEHMRNYDRLLRRIASWLRPEGRLFVHVFCHRQASYPFEVDGPANWMGRYFFTGGMMPSVHLLPLFDRDLGVIEQWGWSGTHYRRTCLAWLENLDANCGAVLERFAEVYGRRQASRWFQRWRMFFLAGAEMFGYAGGNEWFVAHYLLEHCRSPAQNQPHAPFTPVGPS
jgi:cyclopropane-fatty-acyl-phospholipid synthase